MTSVREEQLTRIFLLTTLSEVVATCDVAMTLVTNDEIKKSIKLSRDFAIGARDGVLHAK